MRREQGGKAKGVLISAATPGAPPGALVFILAFTAGCDRDAGAAFGAAAVEDSTAPFGGHALSEAMGSASWLIMRDITWLHKSLTSNKHEEEFINAFLGKSKLPGGDRCGFLDGQKIGALTGQDGAICCYCDLF